LQSKFKDVYGKLPGFAKTVQTAQPMEWKEFLSLASRWQKTIGKVSMSLEDLTNGLYFDLSTR